MILRYKVASQYHISSVSSQLRELDVCFWSDLSYVRHCKTAVNDSRANLHVHNFYFKYFESRFVILDLNIKHLNKSKPCLFWVGLDIFSESISKIICQKDNVCNKFSIAVLLKKFKMWLYSKKVYIMWICRKKTALKPAHISLNSC